MGKRQGRRLQVQKLLSPKHAISAREQFRALRSQNDPGEQHDVIADHPEVVAKMRAAYDHWWSEILPALENENAIGPPGNPFKEAYWKQFGGGPEQEK